MSAATTVIAVAGAAASAYSAYDQAQTSKKAAKAAAKPQTQYQTSTRTPYMEETFRPMATYLLNEGLNNYSRFNTQLGGKPGDFSGLTALLQGQSQASRGPVGQSLDPNGAFAIQRASGENPRFGSVWGNSQVPETR